MRSFCHKIKGLMKIFTSSFGRAVEEWGIKSIQNSITVFYMVIIDRLRETKYQYSIK